MCQENAHIKSVTKDQSQIINIHHWEKTTISWIGQAISLTKEELIKDKWQKNKKKDHLIETLKKDWEDIRWNKRKPWNNQDKSCKKRDLDPHIKLKTMTGIENRTLLTKDHIHLWEIPVEINRRKLFNLQNDDI